MLIGIAGTDGSGKGTVVDYLVQQHGFVHYSSRAIILEHIRAAGLPDTRVQMRLTANELREAHGNDFLVTQALARIERDGVTNAIIESIRATAEAESLKHHGGILLAVDADQLLRFERVQSRRSETDKVSFEQFVAHEDLEKNDPNPHGMQKGKVIEMADYTIMNDQTVDMLHAQIEHLLSRIVP